MEPDRDVVFSDVRDLFSLNLKKAGPILRLLAAQKGYEDGEMPFHAAWSIFKVFLQLPSSVEDGGGTFQVMGTEADPDVLEVYFGRQLSEDTGYGETVTRIVGFEFVFDPPSPDSTTEDELDLSDGVEIWSSDFASVEAFFEAVEQSVGFRMASSRPPTSISFYLQEDLADRKPDDPSA